MCTRTVPYTCAYFINIHIFCCCIPSRGRLGVVTPPLIPVSHLPPSAPSNWCLHCPSLFFFPGTGTSIASHVMSSLNMAVPVKLGISYVPSTPASCLTSWFVPSVRCSSLILSSFQFTWGVLLFFLGPTALLHTKAMGRNNSKI